MKEDQLKQEKVRKICNRTFNDARFLEGVSFPHCQAFVIGLSKKFEQSLWPHFLLGASLLLWCAHLDNSYPLYECVNLEFSYFLYAIYICTFRITYRSIHWCINVNISLFVANNKYLSTPFYLRKNLKIENVPKGVSIYERHCASILNLTSKCRLYCLI